MTDIPILFNAPMVRAILAGQKTQTRRADLKKWTKVKQGDRIWVRETWRAEKAGDGIAPSDLPWIELKGLPIWYEADGKPPERSPWGNPWSAKQRVSIHMPRWASRITLEVTAVRVERLHDISEEDARAEGVERDSDGWRDYQMPSTQCCASAVDSFRTLWKSINGAESWEANPEAAVISFRRIQA